MGSEENSTKLRILSMVLIFYKIAKHQGFIQFSSILKLLNLASFESEGLILLDCRF